MTRVPPSSTPKARAAAKRRPKPAAAGTLPGARQVAAWQDGWEAIRVDAGVGEGLTPEAGKWLLEHGLYAQGADFTANLDNDPSYRGTSTLENLWKGQWGALAQGMAGLRVFVLAHRGTPQGVVAWLHADDDGAPGPTLWFPKTPSHPRHHPTQRLSVVRLGHVMAFLKPEHRGKGVVRRAVADLVMPELERVARRCVKGGSMPILGASDAMGRMVAGLTAIPLVGHLVECRAMRDEAWSQLTWAGMWPERRMPVRRYLVAPEAMPKPKPTPRRRPGR